MFSETFSRATKSPNFLLTFLISILMGSRLSGLGALGGTQQAHHDDADHRGDGEQERSGVGGALVEALVLGLDDEGGGLRLLDDVARDDLHGAVLPERAGEAEHNAVHDGPLDAGQGDPAEGLY